MFNSKLFSINPKTREFVADASDLGNFKLDRIYPDACDMGFEMVSHRTGQSVKWYLMTEMYNGDGDITAWSFNLTPESARKYPDLANWVVLVFND
jgi:hypothetical protein